LAFAFVFLEPRARTSSVYTVTVRVSAAPVAGPVHGRMTTELEELVEVLSRLLPAGLVCRDGDDVGFLQVEHETFGRFGIERAACSFIHNTP
jgi:hypothetical protein